MYLKSLELQGFKSFPDKTVLNFDDGATVIVGPNGSGKSNITDAMRWVLGELSSKNIRGSRMEDVIFIGTEVRKPMSYAEVSVTFDNSSEEGRLNSPYDEITVTRRYYRAGESEYLINRKAVRLKDIYELFMNTGVGREGYSIIGQGRIAEIISKKSEDRRNIFEEAAGISKYRYRKDEAERKLKQTQDNMDRAYDIFHELELRVGPLEKDAEKAKKYNELYERKKVADVSLWIYDTQKIKSDIEKVGNDYKMSAHELEMAQDSVNQIEEQDQVLTEKYQKTRQETDKVEQELRACSTTISALDGDLKLMENNALHAKLSTGAEIAEIEKFEARKAILQAEIEQKEKSVASANVDLKNAQDQYLDIRNEQAEYAKKRDEIAEELERLFAEQKKIEAQRDELKVRVSILESSNSTGKERADSLINDINAYKQELSDMTEKSEVRARAIAKYENTLSTLEEGLQTLDKQIEEKTARYDELKEIMNSLNSKSLALEERINALNSMEELFDGYAKSVSVVMNSYKEGNIDGTIYGPISKLVSVDEKYITAIETALGVGLQHIVVDNEETAKRCISYLKENKAGRATFYPVTSVRGQTVTQEMENAKSYKGYIGIADELIEFDDKFTDIFSSLLGRTLIFDNIDNATEMAKSQKYRVKVVTLDGQQINVGGSFTGGSSKHESTMLSRTSDIKRLQEEKDEISLEIAKIKKEGQGLGEELRNLSSKRSGDKQQHGLIDTVCRAEKTEYETLIAQMNVTKNLIESLEDDNKKIFENEEKNIVEHEKILQEMNALEAEIEKIMSSRMELDITRYDFASKVEESSEKMNQNLIRVAEINKDIESANALLEDAKARLLEIETEISDRKEKMQRLNDEVSSSSEKKAENRRLHEEAIKRFADLEAEKSRLVNLESEIEKKRNELNAKNKEILAKKEQIVRSHTMNEGHLEQLNKDFDKMVAKIYEDYGLTHTTAVELGYPEVTEKNHKEILAIAVECKNKLRSLGSVNPNAIEEYKEVKERYDYMNAQITDLTKSKEDLLKIIEDLEVEMKKSFVDAFNAVNENFNEVFKELFGGGHAELSLTDENDVLNCGIEIKAAPPGKVIKSLMLLSGGEQAFVAIALLFAILKVNPTPFCIFDEIEAALDEVNVGRFGQYIKRYSKQTQFIVITHRRGTMEIADRLYGVTMPQKGISKVLTMDVNDVGKDRILSQNNAK